ncbi:MAG: hypothetical protein ABS49_03060 [Erythrobacter sp. SCN 62-14]|nr:MAG: hypothetical protein ABS49_03060 [Erythrobacter sp. SCN 62-14]
MRGSGVGLALVALLTLASCKDSSGIDAYNDFESRLAKTYQNKPDTNGTPYALIVRNRSGRAWLLTVHGQPDNLAACEKIAAPYNADPSFSVLKESRYGCVPVDDDFLLPVW